MATIEYRSKLAKQLILLAMANPEPTSLAMKAGKGVLDGIIKLVKDNIELKAECELGLEEVEEWKSMIANLEQPR